MTEQQYLASRNPRAMLDFLTSNPGDSAPHHVEYPPARRPSDRKLRLFGHALWEQFRRRGPVPGDFEARVREDLDWIDGLSATQKHWELTSDYPDIFAAGAIDHYTGRDDVRSCSAAEAADLLRDIVGNPFFPVATEADYLHDPDLQQRLVSMAKARGEKNALRHLVRSAWLTADVRHVAADIYRRRAFGELPILADALEDAGCPPDTLETCQECNGLGEVGTLAGTFGCHTCSTDHQTRGSGKVRVAHWLLSHLRSPGPHVMGCWAVDVIAGKE